MRRTTILAITIVLVLPLTAGAAGIEIPLTYQRHPDDEREFHPTGFLRVESTLTKPPGEWKLPKPTSDRVIYGLARFGDREHMMILDRKNTNDAFFSRLYFDTNCNRDLTDDPVIDGIIEASDPNFRMVSFKAIDMEVVVDGKKLPYAFRPQAYYSGPQPMTLESANGLMNFNFYVRVWCSYSATANVNGHSYWIALSDADGSGRFNDAFTLPENAPARDIVYGKGDTFYIASREKLDYYDGLTLAKRLFIDRTLYDVAINTFDGKMTWTRVEGEFAHLKVADEVRRLELYTKDGDSVMAYMPGPMTIPQGEYMLAIYQIVRKDDKGEWRLSAAGRREAPAIRLTSNATTKLVVGEPFRPVVTAPEIIGRGSGNNEARLSFTIRGQGEEQVTDIRLISGSSSKIEMSSKDNGRPKEPTYRVLKTDGEVVTQGSFEYG